MKKEHVIVERVTISGFQPERWVVCRCGWTSPHHYNRGRTLEFFKAHVREMEAGA